MSDYFRFPNGDKVKVLKTADVLTCIENNITDIDVARAVIEHCEKQAKELLKQDKWVSIPYIGNIRRNPNKVLQRTAEQKTAIEKAKTELSLEEYKTFKIDLAKNNEKIIRERRNRQYKASILVGKNKQLFYHLLSVKGENYARLHFILLTSLTIIGDNEREN